MREKFISLLDQLVSFNSVFPNEKEIADFLFDYLDNLGFKVAKHYISDNRYNVLAEKGHSDHSYLLYAHTDTVPVYGSWEDNPLKLRIDGDKAIGLGSADMKGGIVSILKAVEDFNPNKYKLKIAFGVDEENYSEGAYKLSLTDWLSDVKGVLVPESSIPAAKSEKAGTIITLGRKGRAVYLIKLYGKSAHGVEAEKGINAINEAAKLVLALNDFEKTYNPSLGYNSYFVRRLEGKTNSLSIPDYAELELDCHLVYPDTSLILFDKLKSFINNLYNTKYLLKSEKDFELEFSPRPTPFLEPFVYNEKDFFVNLVSQSVKNIYGEYSYNYGNSVADENVFGSLGIPTLTVGPLADNHHSSEEWVSIGSLIKLSEVYRDVLEQLDR